MTLERIPDQSMILDALWRRAWRALAVPENTAESHAAWGKRLRRLHGARDFIDQTETEQQWIVPLLAERGWVIHPAGPGAAQDPPFWLFADEAARNDALQAAAQAGTWPADCAVPLWSTHWGRSIDTSRGSRRDRCEHLNPLMELWRVTIRNESTWGMLCNGERLWLLHREGGPRRMLRLELADALQPGREREWGGILRLLSPAIVRGSDDAQWWTRLMAQDTEERCSRMREALEALFKVSGPALDGARKCMRDWPEAPRAKPGKVYRRGLGEALMVWAMEADEAERVEAELAQWAAVCELPPPPAEAVREQWAALRGVLQELLGPGREAFRELCAEERATVWECLLGAPMEPVEQRVLARTPSGPSWKRWEERPKDRLEIMWSLPKTAERFVAQEVHAQPEARLAAQREWTKAAYAGVEELAGPSPREELQRLRLEIEASKGFARRALEKEWEQRRSERFGEWMRLRVMDASSGAGVRVLLLLERMARQVVADEHARFGSGPERETEELYVRLLRHAVYALATGPTQAWLTMRALREATGAPTEGLVWWANPLVGAMLPELSVPPRERRSGKGQRSIFDLTFSDEVRSILADFHLMESLPGDAPAPESLRDRLRVQLERFLQLADLWVSDSLLKRLGPDDYQQVVVALGESRERWQHALVPHHERLRAMAQARVWHWPLRFPETRFVAGREDERAGFALLTIEPAQLSDETIATWQRLRGEQWIVSNLLSHVRPDGRVAVFGRLSGDERASWPTHDPAEAKLLESSAEHCKIAVKQRAKTESEAV